MTSMGTNNLNNEDMRNKFRKGRLCSSDNYELSKKKYIDNLREEHYKNVEIIHEISKKIIVKKKAYVRCFDKLYEVSEEEARTLTTCTIIWK